MAFLNPIQVLDNINLKNNAVVADFGSGSGAWVIPVAKRTKEGTIYAIDVMGSPLAILKKRAEDEKLSNIKTIQTDIEDGSQLPEKSCDLVLITNLLFAVKDKEGVLKEGVRILKEGGHLLVVDWKEDSPMQLESPVLPIQVEKITDQLGLKKVKTLSTGVYHWGLFFRK